jgi:ribose/xylose/arabinose/galactoside ABC-type transport system permease subunit
MSAATVSRERRRLRLRVPPKYVPVLSTLVLLVTMFTAGALRYPEFGSLQVVLNVFIDNSFLLVVVVGMTFVILTGGIDLSVGSVVALSTLTLALLEKHGWPLLVSIAVVLVIGSVLGLAMGSVIHYFEIQPFIVTLAGMFLARGICFAITDQAVSITQPRYVAVAEHSFTLPGGYYVTTAVLVALVAVAIGIYVLHYTRLGRNVYAIGGNAQSALLMGLPVARTRIAVYTISGFCSALGGVLLSFYMLSGSGSLAIGLELDAIAAVVIGGTLLSGGTGYLAGSVLGVLVLGLIQTLISFQGTLSSWWTRIVIGLLLLAFILLQRLAFLRKDGSRPTNILRARTQRLDPSPP